MPFGPTQAAHGRRVTTRVRGEQLDLIGREVEPVTAPVLEEQVVAGGAPHGPGDHAPVSGHPVLAMDHVAARCQVVEEPVDGTGAGPGLPVGTVAAGDVGLGQDGHPAARQDESAVHRPHHDACAGCREVGGVRRHRDGQPLLGQDAREALRTPVGRRAQHHRVAGPGEGGDLRGQLGTVPEDRLPPPALHRRHVRALRRRNQRDHAGVRPGQQPVEWDVEARRPAPALEAPGGRQRVGQGRLLVEQLAGTVPDPAGLDQDDDGIVPQQVADQLLGVGQPRQPRLHAVELVAVGEALPLVAPPRCRPHQLGRPPAGHLVGHQLAAAEELHRSDVLDRALVRHVEAGEPIDLVPPKVEADRLVRGGREDIHDAAPHGQLPAVLDDRLAAVAHGHQADHQLIDHDPVTLGHHHRPRRGAPGAEPLEHRLDRGHDDVRPRSTGARGARGARGAAQLPQQAQAAAHGRHVGADPLEGKGLPCREHLDPAGARIGRLRPAGERPEIVGQLVGGGPGRCDHEHRPPGAQADEAGQHEGLGRRGHRQGGAGRADDPRHGGLVAQQGGERAEAHLLRVPGRAPSAGRLSGASAPSGTAGR